MTFTAIAVFVIDQVTKFFVVHYLELKFRTTMNVVDPFLNFRMAWNEGINFGIPLANKWVLIALALVICAWIVIWMLREKPGRFVQISAGLVVGGAIGNVVDRVLYGAVADFLNMSCCGWENPWSFNVADIAIFIGAVGLIFLSGDASKSRDAEGSKM
jgi:signal peptidase II